MIPGSCQDVAHYNFAEVLECGKWQRYVLCLSSFKFVGEYSVHLQSSKEFYSRSLMPNWPDLLHDWELWCPCLCAVFGEWFREFDTIFHGELPNDEDLPRYSTICGKSICSTAIPYQRSWICSLLRQVKSSIQWEAVKQRMPNNCLEMHNYDININGSILCANILWDLAWTN